MTETKRNTPLMAKATAVWLIDRTTLTFQQIADSCGLHILEVENLANSSEVGLQGSDPIREGQLTQAEIDRCQRDETATLRFENLNDSFLPKQKKERRYVSRIYRHDRPDAIAWVVKHYPGLTDYQICKLLSTTSGTVQKIRQKTHVNSISIKPRHPVTLGLCTDQELQEATRALRPPEIFEEA